MESAKGEARFFNSCVIIYVDGTCEGTLVICTVTLTKVNLATVLMRAIRVQISPRLATVSEYV